MPRLIFICCLLATAPTLANQPGLWLEHDGTTSGPEAALSVSTQVDIQVTGMLAEVRMKQRFFNPGQRWAEGIYRFPLPDGVAVEELSIQIGQRRIEGEIQERQQARATYQVARDSGRIAGLVEHEQSNLFTTRVANIGPAELIEIEIGFSQAIRYEHGRFQLHFPTSAAPDFRPPASLERSVEQQLETTLGGEITARPFELLVDLRPGLALAQVQAIHHAIEVEAIGSDYLISLAEGADWSGRDFELEWQPLDSGQANHAAFAESFDGQEHLMLMLVPPQAFEADDTPREMILIIDTSGSMGNEPIRQARESLHYALASLRPGDRFNVIEFNHQARALYPQPVAFDPQRLSEASVWVDRLAAGGGTTMGPPLNLALAQAPEPGFLRQILFITDGMVGNEAELVRRVEHAIGDSRLFTVGIGHGVNGSFLRRLSQAGRGSYTAIAETSTIAARMSELVLQLESPVIHDLELDWPVPAEVHPERIPDLYVGQPLMVFARTERLAGDLVLRGTSNGRHFERIVALESFQPAAGVASQWARHRIAVLEQLLAEPEQAESARSELLDTALAYRLLSSQTSLVAVDRSPARSREAALMRQRLETGPAHGRSNTLHAMPATDAGSVPALVRGSVALLLVVLLLFQGRIKRDEDAG